MTNSNGVAMRRLVWGLVLLLAILHFDFWYWDDSTLVFGFLPVGLAYQAAFSLACGVVWALAVRFAWPTEIEAWADSSVDHHDSAHAEHGAKGASR